MLASYAARILANITGAGGGVHGFRTHLRLPYPAGDPRIDEVVTAESLTVPPPFLGEAGVLPSPLPGHWLLVIGTALQWLYVTAERLDPVRVAPLTREGGETPDGLVGFLPVGQDAFSVIVYLDFVGTNTTPEQLAFYRSDLVLNLENRGGLWYHDEDGQPISQVLLTLAEFRSLDPARSYLLVPKTPYSVTWLRQHTTFTSGELFINAAVWYGATPYTMGTHSQRTQVDIEP